MLAVIVTLRDLLIVLALSWVGVTFEQSPTKERANTRACGGGETVCTSLTPGFDALECGKR